MTLNQELKEWQERFVALLEEGHALLKRIEETESRHNVWQESLVTAVQSQDSGLDAIAKLYQDGFHICHARFAQPLDEECLFCISLLQNKGIKPAGRNVSDEPGQ